MASRLMLSLRRASVDPSEPWYLNTVPNLGGGHETLRFATRTLDEGDIELSHIPQTCESRMS